MIDKTSFTPIYIQIKNEILDQIKLGAIKKGDKLPSENELAKEYEVSRLTVRQALGELTASGIIEKRQGKGAFCIGTGSNHKQEKNIYVMLDLSDTYFTPYYIKSISNVIARNKVNFMMKDTLNNKDTIKKLLAEALENDAAGVIFQPSPERACEDEELIDIVKRIENSNIPCVMIDNAYQDVEASYALMDEFNAGEKAAEIFSKYGHTSLAFVYSNRHEDSLLREAGFVAKVRELGLEEPKIINSKAFKKDELEGVTGLFCYNDYVANFMLEQLSEMGISVPEQMSIVGCDDSIIASCTSPRLTTIKHPKSELGAYVAKKILARIKNKSVEKFYERYEPEIVIRKSLNNR